MSNQYSQDSIKDIINELDKETAKIVISKEIRGRYKKTSTVIRGMAHSMKDQEIIAITSELKTKWVLEAPIKKGELSCKEITGRLLNSC